MNNGLYSAENNPEDIIHVFVVGSKGIPSRYGGFETFVENLTKNKKSPNIFYHVSCMDNKEGHFKYNGADCFNVKLPLKGSVGRILHVSRVLSQIKNWKKKNIDKKAIVYILGCRIGPLIILHKSQLEKLKVKIFVNPDGLEWKRDKWNALEKRFLKLCEKYLVENADLAICDSLNIEKYIREAYPKIKNNTTFIAYGASIKKSVCSDEKLNKWLTQFDVKKNEYFLIVGRFVPENNYETMISEFMKTNTKKPLIIISNIEENKFFHLLRQKTNFESDSRIKFVGTVYDEQLLKKIRENAFAYIHGHEVGGTNPSLLEALSSTKLNLLLNVGFNQEVAEDGALYWSKNANNMAKLIDKTEAMSAEDITEFGIKAKKRITDQYRWEYIVESYEKVFLGEHGQD